MIVNNEMELQLEQLLKERTGPCSRNELQEVLDSTDGSFNDYRLEHTRRVVEMAKRLSQELGADTGIITLAAWLHDIAKPGSTRVENHSEKSAEIAGEILERKGFDKESIQRVKDIIRKHVGLTRSKELKPIEAQILWEADKLDKLGLSGFIQAVLNWARKDVGKTMVDIAKYQKEYLPLAKKISESMFTSIGVRIAQERYDHLLQLCTMLEREIIDHHGVELSYE